MGTVLLEQDQFDATIVCPNPLEPVSAADGPSRRYGIPAPALAGTVTYLPLLEGARVRHLGGVNKTLDVTVSGNDITVQLATDGLGNVTSTANDVVAKYITVLAATNLATAIAFVPGTSPAGVHSDWLPLLNTISDAYGSVRPGFQALTNRSRYFYNSIILGTRSVKSLYADATGAVAVSTPAGEVWGVNAVQAGAAGVQRLRSEPHRFKWLSTGTGITDANPPPSQALANDLRAKGIVKAQGTIITNGTGGITLFNALSCSVDIAGGHLRVTMLTPMADTNYNIAVGMDDSIIGTGGAYIRPGVNYRVISTTQFLLPTYNSTVYLDPASSAYRVSFIVTGQQNT